MAGNIRRFAKCPARRDALDMSEINERLGDLERKINHDRERLDVLRRFVDLPGEYLVCLVKRGLLSDSTNLRSRHWHELALAMKDLDSVQQYLSNRWEDILRCCGSASSSWESMSNSWNPLIQHVESFKDARVGFLEIKERVRAITENLPEGFSGIVEELAASKQTEVLVLESDSKKIREAIERTEAAIKKLEGGLGEMETESEGLIRRLRDNQQGC